MIKRAARATERGAVRARLHSNPDEKPVHWRVVDDLPRAIDDFTQSCEGVKETPQVRELLQALHEMKAAWRQEAWMSNPHAGAYTPKTPNR